MYEEVLTDWNFWGGYNIDYLGRDYSLQEFVGEGRALILFGVRRAGKSYLAYGYLKRMIGSGLDPKETLILNFEDPRLSGIDSRELIKLYEEYLKLTGAKRPIVVLDEVQSVEGWERFVRYLLEVKRAKVLVTGSSSKLMGEEYATLLTGRHVSIEVFPLSFREFLRFKGLEIKSEAEALKERSRIRALLDEYLEYGGFPEVALQDSRAVKEELLRTYFRDIVTKDVAMRYNVRRVRKLESLARIYVSNVATMVSMRKLSKSLEIGLRTVERFSEYLETARVIRFLKRLSPKAKEVERSRRKVYTIDVGFHTKAGLPITRNLGRIMENVVFLHLAREYGVNEALFYYLTSDGREVDFVVREGRKTVGLIQVTHHLRKGDPRQFRREVGSLVRASKELGCRRAVLITMDQEGLIEEKGVKVKVTPLWKWLLGFEV